jgi:hypothetical protein
LSGSEPLERDYTVASFEEGDVSMVLKRLGPLSCAKIAGTLYAIIGLLVGAIFALVSLASGLGANPSGDGGFRPFIGIGAIVAFPILYGGMGFVMTLLGAWLYNILADAVGGIELDLQ